jgi:cell division transport system ATP-binding protein
MSAIVFQNVSKEYPGGFIALKDINLAIESGEFVSFVGASGAGKSTLLKMVYAEDFPSQGDVIFYERPTTDIKRRLLPYYRRNFGTVFQDFKLLEKKTVSENVAFALEVDGRTADEIQEEVPKILSIVRLESKQELYPKQLSGGERQRVSMARALIHQPKVLIADEPTGNLDPVSAQDILQLLLKINELGTTVLLATHDKDIVNRLQRRVITLDNGAIVRDEQVGQYVI